MRSTCLDEYQHAVLRYDNLFLFCGNGRVLVLAHSFFDLLFDFEQGGVQRGCLVSDFWEVGNMGCAAVCRECAKHRVRLVFNRNAVLHARQSCWQMQKWISANCAVSLFPAPLCSQRRNPPRVSHSDSGYHLPIRFCCGAEVCP